MKRWTNGYGETVVLLEVGDAVRYTSPKQGGVTDTTITAILPQMPGYYRLAGVAEAVWKESIQLIGVTDGQGHAPGS